MWFEREISPYVRRAVESRPAVVMTGARQTGKTSLLRRLFPHFHFISLDLPSDAELAIHDPSAFLVAHPPPVLIDEVQYAPNVFRHIKAVVDRDRSKTGLFLLTGSQRYGLMQEVSESLAGRVEILELEPLSLFEIGHAKRPPGIEAVVLRGGYPELYQTPGLDSFLYYRSYIAAYLERDVRNILNVGSLRDFERFLRACALRSGQLLNKSDLARDVGISPSTAGEWISTLQASGQIYLLEPWFSSRTKSIYKSPKLYLADTGLLTALLNIQSVEEMMRSPLVGPIWETFVFAELRKREMARTGRWAIHFWSDRRREVDFIIDRGGRLEMYEAKWTQHPDRDDTEHLRHLREMAGANVVDRLSVVCRAPRTYPLEDGVSALSAYDLRAQVAVKPERRGAPR
ncbi:MAG: ATP-binding protein [Bryobacteraceae bacterium]|nr:ATP-binding protein [Bryobacteraceae bacterium]